MRNRLPDDGDRNGHSTLPAELGPRAPISDIRAEQGLIGSLVWDSTIIDELTLPGGVFYLESHGKILELIRNKRDAGEAVDILTLDSDLPKDGTNWDAVITAAVDVAQHPGNWRYYAKIVRERWTRRTCCYTATKFIHELYTSPDSDAIIARHLESMARLTESSEADDATECSTGLMRVLDGWKNPASKGISTGYPEVDQHIGGWQAQRLYMLAAKTAIGKSALAINFAAHVAKSGPVLFISLEMPEEEVYTRLASSVLRKSSDDMRGTVYAEQDTSELSDGFHNVSQLQFKVDDRGGRTVSSIAGQARKHLRKYGLSLLVVDYLGLIEPADKRVSRYEQIGSISRGLKLIAKNLKIPVLTLCQLNRQADGDGVKPQLHHLREAGNLEQDSDVVMFIHRDRHGTDTELLIEKNRSGKCGMVKLIWNSNFVKYDSAAWRNAEAYDPLSEPWDNNI